MVLLEYLYIWMLIHMLCAMLSQIQGWVAGGPLAPTSGLSNHETQRFTTHLVHVVTLMQCTSVYKPLLHALQLAPKRQFCCKYKS